MNDRIEDASSFTGGGATFATEGAKPGRSGLNLGTEVKFLSTQRWDLTASYDFDYKADYISNAGYLRVGYKF